MAVSNTDHRPPGPVGLRSRSRTAVSWAVMAVIVLFLGTPLLSMFIFSMRQPLTGDWTLDAWKSIFTGTSSTGSLDLQPLWQGLIASLIMCLMTVGIMLVILLPTMVAVRIRYPGLKRIIEFLCLLPLTIPAIALVVGLGPLYRWLAWYVTGTNAIWLSLAYVVLVLPYSYRTLDSGLRSIRVGTLVEASTSLGASYLYTLLRVVVPNLRAAILSACFISIAVVLGEFTIASILARTNLQTAVYGISQTDAAVAVGMSLLAMVFVMVLLLVLGLATSKNERKKK